MRKFHFPTQDASIYEQYPTRQTGLDEMLEVGKSSSVSGSVRSLIQFDLSSFATLYPAEAEYDLVLKIAYADKIKRGQLIEAVLVSQSWTEGAGYFYQDRYEEDYGVTWKTIDGSTPWPQSGSTFLTGSVSASFVNYTTDLTMSVTNLVRRALSGSNYGFLLKFPSGSEADSTNRGIIRFFSKDTHTVHTPLLVVKYGTQTFATGTLSSSLGVSQLKVQAKNLQKSYLQDEDVTLQLTIRELYPLKTFENVFSEWTGNYYLPSGSQFSVVDAAANVEIIPFDSYSPIDVENNMNVVRFSTKAMYPLRWYKLRYKTIRNGSIEIYDDPQLFTIRQI